MCYIKLTHPYTYTFSIAFALFFMCDANTIYFAWLICNDLATGQIISGINNVELCMPIIDDQRKD